MRPLTILALVVLAVVLAACAEREQTANGIKSDAAPYQGTNRPFVATGWKPGDRNSWEQQMKVRTVQGQNDYAKVP
jgi:predicted small secreted protein